MDQWLSEIFKSYKNQPNVLIGVLQKIQDKIGYIPEDSIEQISKFLKISRSKIFGVASFYSQFKFTKPPKHSIKVCLGTACHVRGGQNLVDVLEKELKITCGNVTQDGKFGLERVACFGCCALGPIVVVDNKVYGRMTPQKIKKLVVQISE